MKNLVRWLVASGCALLAACAIITVNVYFPEKAAKEAYKSLDELLLKSDGGKAPAAQQPPLPSPDQPHGTPQSGLLPRLPRLALLGVAMAADNEADALAIEMASMPEVNKAYAEMSQRMPRINALLDSGAIGLTSQGLVTVRDKTKVAAGDDTLIEAENKSRKTIVGSMARAILKLNKQKESEAAINQLMGKAATTYAETRREAAKPGWWMQLPNGRWVQK